MVERRRFARASGPLVLRAEPLRGDPPELPPAEARVAATWTAEGELAEEVRRQLERISEQLNLIMEVLRDRRVLRMLRSTPAVVEISGAGLRFRLAERVRPGQLLALSLLLPLGVPVLVRAIGRVVRVEATPDGQEVAVEFTRIREEDRERLVRYVFELEREALRRRREG